MCQDRYTENWDLDKLESKNKKENKDKISDKYKSDWEHDHWLLLI